MQALEQQRDQDHGDQPCKYSLVLSNKWGCLLQVRNSFHSSLHVVVRFCWWIGIWLSLAPGSSDSSNIGRDQHECILNSWKQGLKLCELGSLPDLAAFESLVTRRHSSVTRHLSLALPWCKNTALISAPQLAADWDPATVAVTILNYQHHHHLLRSTMLLVGNCSGTRVSSASWWKRRS